ncbi:MAG: TlpA family protein disulfide reductase [Acidobacteriota bacterium]|nr:TlpA family protein disulfide reductase [Acidobacteriota bacterium]
MTEIKISSVSLTKIIRLILFGFIFVQLCSFGIFAQKKGKKKPLVKTVKTVRTAVSPKVEQVDATALRNLLKTNGKPLLVNFWATWCDPCREEFPDLVKIDSDYGEKIDFITVSLDDAEELNTGVPKFLTEMKAQMPAFLLATQNEDAVIASVSKDWQGGLPFTILYDADGKIAYSRMGKVKIDVLRIEIEKLIKPDPAKSVEPKVVSKVKFIDESELSKIISSRKEKERPLFINFWATWCKPCIKELPDLMKIQNEFESRGIDFILVSTDSIGSMDERVSVFLQTLDVTMPSYILKIKNKDTMFTLMPFWNRVIPFSVLYDGGGNVAFAYTGIVETKRLKSEIEQILSKNLAKN